MFNHQNIESYIIEYLDGELDTSTSQQLLQWIDQHPTYQSILEDFKSAYISIDKDEVDQIIFPLKQQLLHKTNPYQKWWIPLGMAASLTIIISWYFWNPNSNTKEEMQPKSIATNNQATTISNPTIHPTVGTVINNNSATPTQAIFATKSTNTNIAQHNKDNYNIHHTVQQDHNINTFSPLEKLDWNDAIQPLEISQNIDAYYVSYIQEVAITNNELPNDDVEWTVAGVAFTNEYNKVKNIHHKWNQLKDKVSDNLAQMSEVNINFFK